MESLGGTTFSVLYQTVRRLKPYKGNTQWILKLRASCLLCLNVSCAHVSEKLPCWSSQDLCIHRGVDNFWEVGGLSLYRAAGSHLRMVRPSLMLVVKLVAICARKVRCKILDLASYLPVRWCSHCTSASNWELPLLCCPTLQGTSSLIENTIFSYCCEREKIQCVAQVEDLATYNSPASLTELVYDTACRQEQNWQSAYVQCSQWVCCT